MAHLTFYLIVVGSLPFTIHLHTMYLMVKAKASQFMYTYQYTHHYTQIVETITNVYYFLTQITNILPPLIYHQYWSCRCCQFHSFMIHALALHPFSTNRHSIKYSIMHSNFKVIHVITIHLHTHMWNNHESYNYIIVLSYKNWCHLNFYFQQ
jgi:hypothetical protein